MNSIRIKIFLLIIFFISSLSSAEQIEELKEEERATLLGNRTEITIKCNTLHADVFINGVYQGKTKLTLRNMQEGLYKLRLEKRGYKSCEYLINVETELSKSFYVELYPAIFETKNQTEENNSKTEDSVQESQNESPEEPYKKELIQEENTETPEVDTKESTKDSPTLPWWKRWLFNE